MKKDDYTKIFKKSNLTDGSYDIGKLKLLIDDIINS